MRYVYTTHTPNPFKTPKHPPPFTSPQLPSPPCPPKSLPKPPNPFPFLNTHPNPPLFPPSPRLGAAQPAGGGGAAAQAGGGQQELVRQRQRLHVGAAQVMVVLECRERGERKGGGGKNRRSSCGATHVPHWRPNQPSHRVLSLSVDPPISLFLEGIHPPKGARCCICCAGCRRQEGQGWAGGRKCKKERHACGKECSVLVARCCRLALLCFLRVRSRSGRPIVSIVCCRALQPINQSINPHLYPFAVQRDRSHLENPIETNPSIDAPVIPSVCMDGAQIRSSTRTRSKNLRRRHATHA